MINYLIEEKDVELSKTDTEKIIAKFYDQVKFLKSLLKEAVEAREKGENISIPEISLRTKRPRRKNKDELSEVEVTDCPTTERPTD